MFFRRSSDLRAPHRELMAKKRVLVVANFWSWEAAIRACRAASTNCAASPMLPNPCCGRLAEAIPPPAVVVVAACPGSGPAMGSARGWEGVAVNIYHL